MEIDPFIFRVAIFVLSIFVGYFVVWSVTPALHTPLMAVTNAISSVIIVGALLAVGVDAESGMLSKLLGFIAKFADIVFPLTFFLLVHGQHALSYQEATENVHRG